MDQARQSWVTVPPGSHFPLQNLPYGVFSDRGGTGRPGVAIGEQVLDLAALVQAGLLVDGTPSWFSAPSLNRFMAAGPAAWQATRERITGLLTGSRYRREVTACLIPQNDVEMLLPFEPGDYVDFYASRDHAATVGEIFRPGEPPLPANWLHMPVGYHGRSGSMIVSGQDIYRPCGQYRPSGGAPPVFGPTQRLDFEAEVGFVAGVPARRGQSVPVTGFEDHVFGFVLVNDWSARDIQSLESRPLGPFLGKSFATSVSPWVVTVPALAAARVAQPVQAPQPLPYLRCPQPWGLDLSLEIQINGHVISHPSFRQMYWTPPQLLAHATVNGAPVRTGDLFASGTVSGPGRDERGCLLEITWDGQRPLELPDGTTRTYLRDGDTVQISATAPSANGTRLGFGAVQATVTRGVR